MKVRIQGHTGTMEIKSIHVEVLQNGGVNWMDDGRGSCKLDEAFPIANQFADAPGRRDKQHLTSCHAGRVIARAAVCLFCLVDLQTDLQCMMEDVCMGPTMDMESPAFWIPCILDLKVWTDVQRVGRSFA